MLLLAHSDCPTTMAPATALVARREGSGKGAGRCDSPSAPIAA